MENVITLHLTNSLSGFWFLSLSLYLFLFDSFFPFFVSPRLQSGPFRQLFLTLLTVTLLHCLLAAPSLVTLRHAGQTLWGTIVFPFSPSLKAVQWVYPRVRLLNNMTQSQDLHLIHFEGISGLSKRKRQGNAIAFSRYPQWGKGEIECVRGRLESISPASSLREKTTIGTN